MPSPNARAFDCISHESYKTFDRRKSTLCQCYTAYDADENFQILLEFKLKGNQQQHYYGKHIQPETWKKKERRRVKLTENSYKLTNFSRSLSLSWFWIVPLIGLTNGLLLLLMNASFSLFFPVRRLTFIVWRVDDFRSETVLIHYHFVPKWAGCKYDVYEHTNTHTLAPFEWPFRTFDMQANLIFMSKLINMEPEPIISSPEDWKSKSCTRYSSHQYTKRASIRDVIKNIRYLWLDFQHGTILFFFSLLLSLAQSKWIHSKSITIWVCKTTANDEHVKRNRNSSWAWQSPKPISTMFPTWFLFNIKLCQLVEKGNLVSSRVNFGFYFLFSFRCSQF